MRNFRETCRVDFVQIENLSYTSADLSKVVNWTEFWTDPGNPRTHLVGGKGEML